MNQDGGMITSGPHEPDFDTELILLISSQEILEQTNISVMQQANAKCPEVYFSCKAVEITLLGDYGSEVILLCKSYLEKYIMSLVK